MILQIQIAHIQSQNLHESRSGLEGIEAAVNSLRISAIQLSISAFNLFNSSKFSSVRANRGSSSPVLFSSSHSVPEYRSFRIPSNLAAPSSAALICFRRPVDRASSNFHQFLSKREGGGGTISRVCSYSVRRVRSSRFRSQLNIFTNHPATRALFIGFSILASGSGSSDLVFCMIFMMCWYRLSSPCRVCIDARK
jgi:hypothetical protein